MVSGRFNRNPVLPVTRLSRASPVRACNKWILQVYSSLWSPGLLSPQFHSGLDSSGLLELLGPVLTLAGSHGGRAALPADLGRHAFVAFIEERREGLASDNTSLAAS